MALNLTADDAKQSLTAHVQSRGEEICARFGPHIGWRELQRILEDRTCVRYPCEILFDSAPLLPGELAHPVQNGETPEDGFKLYVHPIYMTDLASVTAIVLYQLVVVNYGEFASPDDAEAFGSAVLGMSKDEYYNLLCELADSLGQSV